MNELKKLVEKIIEYTKKWSITEDEWYWNIDCVRKSNNTENKNITNEEFEVAIREEILYDLVFNNGTSIEKQMEVDFCEYTGNYFEKDSIELEKEIQKFIKSFKIDRF